MSVLATPQNGSGTLPLEDLPIGRESQFLERLQTLLPEGQAELAKLDEQEALLKSVYHERLMKIQELRRGITGFLRQFGVEVPTRQQQQQSTATVAKKTYGRSAPGVSHEALVKLIDTALSYGNELFSAMELHEKACPERNKSGTHSAVNFLNEVQFLGKGPKQPNRGGARLYHVLDPAIGERLKASDIGRASPTPPTNPQRPQISFDRYEQIAEAASVVQHRTGEPISARQVIDQLAGSKGKGKESNIRAGIRDLKEVGYLKEVGTRKENNAPRPSVVFDIDNRDALEALRK